jgi:hypothetical protein
MCTVACHTDEEVATSACKLPGGWARTAALGSAGCAAGTDPAAVGGAAGAAGFVAACSFGFIQVDACATPLSAGAARP